MSVKKRLKEFIKFKGMKISPFERSVDVSIGYVSSISRGIGNDILQRISDKYPELNITWLLTGGGEMIIPDDTNIVGEAKVYYGSNYLEVPMINVKAQAGYLHTYGDPEYIDSLPTELWIVDKQYKGKYVDFEVEGDSMDDRSVDSICAGDHILCREIQRQHWTNKLHINKWSFVIVHKSMGVIIKRITDHNIKTGDIRCHSLNSFYEDYTINLEDVVALYNVLKINRSL